MRDRVVCLDEICTFMTGGTPKTSHPEYYDKGNIPWMVSGDIHKVIINDCEKRITELGLEKSNAKYLPENSVLIALNGQGKTRGTVALLKAKGMTCNQSIVSIIPKPNVNLDVVYLFQILRSLYKNIRNITGDKDRAGLNIPLLKSIKIPLPPLLDQQKIAEILDAADVLRQKDQQLIDHYTALSQSLFLDMFGDPLVGDTFLLSESIEIIGGYAFKSSDFVEEGIPLVKIGTVNKGYFDITNFSFLPNSYFQKYDKWIVRKGDVLMSLTGTVGKDDYGNVEKATGDYPCYFLNQRVARISPISEEYLTDFLFGMLSNPKTKRELTKISRGVRQANISNKDLMALKIIKPSITKQQKYVSAVEKIEKQKQQAEASLAQSNNLFNSLLQKAFTGELTQQSERAA